MSTALHYQFANTLGSVYSGGSVSFYGRNLLIPTHDNVSVYDLVNTTTHALSLECAGHVTHVTVMPPSATSTVSPSVANGAAGVADAASGDGGRRPHALIIDDSKQMMLVHLHRRRVIARMGLKAQAAACVLSACGSFFALAQGRHVQIWRTPPMLKVFAPFKQQRTLTGFVDDVTCISWCEQNPFLLVAGSKDHTVRIFSRNPLLAVREGGGGAEEDMDEEEEDDDEQERPKFRSILLSAHRAEVCAAFFVTYNVVLSVSVDGCICVWRGTHDVAVECLAEGAPQRSTVPSTWALDAKHYIKQEKYSSSGGGGGGDGASQWRPKVTCAALRRTGTATAGTAILVCGFSSGVFGVWEIDAGRAGLFADDDDDDDDDGTQAARVGVSLLHTLSASKFAISSVAINADGDWIAVCSKEMGQLLVWEWRSESIVARQQGHEQAVISAAYSPCGSLVATGGREGKVKLWNADSGVCYATLAGGVGATGVGTAAKEAKKTHAGPVTGCEFASKKHVLFTCGADGTVKAHDLTRYRTFRIFTAPTGSAGTSFSCVAVCPGGDLVAAGSSAGLDIFVWAVQTGRLTSVLGGHTAPISSIDFSRRHAAMLASASWDGTVRLWDVMESDASTETMRYGAAGQGVVVGLCYRPDGREVCSSTLSGLLCLWDTDDGTLKGTIDAQRDIVGAGARSKRQVHFPALAYSPGAQLIAVGGNCPFVCLYLTSSRLLVRKLQITYNYLHLRGVRGGGGIGDYDEELASARKRRAVKPPRDPGKRQVDVDDDDVFQVTSVIFSPSGQQLAISAVGVGTVLYGVDAADEQALFDPTFLDIDVTPAHVERALATGREHLTALVLALRLDDNQWIECALLAVPAAEVRACVAALPLFLLPSFVRHLAALCASVDAQRHVELLLTWCQWTMDAHGETVRNHRALFVGAMRQLRKCVGTLESNVGSLCDRNMYAAQFLISEHKRRREALDHAEQ